MMRDDVLFSKYESKLTVSFPDIIDIVIIILSGNQSKNIVGLLFPWHQSCSNSYSATVTCQSPVRLCMLGSRPTVHDVACSSSGEMSPAVESDCEEEELQCYAAAVFTSAQKLAQCDTDLWIMLFTFPGSLIFVQICFCSQYINELMCVVIVNFSFFEKPKKKRRLDRYRQWHRYRNIHIKKYRLPYWNLYSIPPSVLELFSSAALCRVHCYSNHQMSPQRMNSGLGKLNWNMK